MQQEQRLWIRICTRKGVPVGKVEPLVWEFVSGLLKDPQRIRAGMEALIDHEHEAGVWRPAEEEMLCS